MAFSRTRAACYRHVLTLKPKHFDALHMLGVLAIQTQHLAEAVTLIAEAVTENPNIAAAHRNYALALHNVGRKAQAIDCYERSIALEPTFCDAYVHLAGLLVEARSSAPRIREAAGSFAKFRVGRRTTS
jgi:Flp pilus assembly protein TadD